MIRLSHVVIAEPHSPSPRENRLFIRSAVFHRPLDAHPAGPAAKRNETRAPVHTIPAVTEAIALAAVTAMAAAVGGMAVVGTRADHVSSIRRFAQTAVVRRKYRFSHEMTNRSIAANVSRRCARVVSRDIATIRPGFVWTYPGERHKWRGHAWFHAPRRRSFGMFPWSARLYLTQTLARRVSALLIVLVLK